MSETTWRKELEATMGSLGESWDDVERCTLTNEQLDDVFDNSFGTSEGEPFTLWTADNVYFPAVYNGKEWVAVVPRNPIPIATNHVGGQ